MAQGRPHDIGPFQAGQGVQKKEKVLEGLWEGLKQKTKKNSEPERTEQQVIILPVTACGSVLWVKNMNNSIQDFNPAHCKAAVI